MTTATAPYGVPSHSVGTRIRRVLNPVQHRSPASASGGPPAVTICNRVLRWATADIPTVTTRLIGIRTYQTFSPPAMIDAR